MKFAELNDEQRQSIKDAIKTTLMKLGVNVDVDVFAKDIRGSEFVCVKTSTFQTFPVIYQSIMVEGSGAIHEDVCEPKYHELDISLHYSFDYFKGGSNGVEIGWMHFRINSKTHTVINLGLKI